MSCYSHLFSLISIALKRMLYLEFSQHLLATYPRYFGT